MTICKVRGPILFVIVNGVGDLGSLRRAGIGYNALGERRRPKDEEEMDVSCADDSVMARSDETSADEGDELERNGVNHWSDGEMEAT